MHTQLSHVGMSQMFRPIGVSILLSAFMAAETFACTIDLEAELLRNIEQRVAQATWVFSGEVVSLQDLGEYRHRVEVAVRGRFKGDIGETVVVRTMQNGLGITCFTPLAIGRVFVFFGERAADGEIDVSGWDASSGRGPELLAAIEVAIADQESQP